MGAQGPLGAEGLERPPCNPPGGRYTKVGCSYTKAVLPRQTYPTVLLRPQGTARATSRPAIARHSGLPMASVTKFATRGATSTMAVTAMGSLVGNQRRSPPTAFAGTSGGRSVVVYQESLKGLIIGTYQVQL